MHDRDPGLPGINAKNYSKNKAKRAGDMAQMVELLPSKIKALSLNNSTSERKKKEKEKEERKKGRKDYRLQGLHSIQMGTRMKERRIMGGGLAGTHPT
jgi:hypothetical protein